MELFNLFWIFLIISAVVPLLRKRMVDASRLRIMRSIEEQRGSRVITLIHRQERMSFLGFPMARYIDIQDSESILRAIKLTDPRVPIDLILHTPGGLVLASEQIANALSRHPAKVTVFVPHYAMSGGTMIALAANEIVMDENAVLGPVDPQIGQYPAVSILKVLKSKDANKIDDATMILADISEKAVNQVKATIRRLGCCHYTPEEAERLSEDLASGRWTHDYPISTEEARELGLKISTEMPTAIYQLMNLYPQATTRRPSVDFVPLPYPHQPSLPERSDRENR
ncbi:MAG TPA: ATP-dependent Clp protease proteolytic subunit [Levilinea sp.]|nr:ATP-dependent Clp protease proteolytic subunit [Levilinea sp.]